MNKLLILLAFFSTTCFSQWQLDSANSEVTFVSTKNSHIREIHKVPQVSFALSTQNKVSIGLDLSSIESGIPIRNERMKAMLFDIANFQTATLAFTVPAALETIQETTRYTLPANLALHDISREISIDIILTPSKDGITGSLAQPVIINAADYNLVSGIDALKTVAGLNSIGYSVPVYATLALTKK